MLKKATKLYIQYIETDYKKKLHVGHLLAESGQILRGIDEDKLDKNSKLQRQYLIKKVAEDLLSQTRDMAYTKQYDCSPLIKDYTYLAFYLAFEYYGPKANRLLLPFLRDVINYEKYKSDKTKLESLKKMFYDSIIKEKECIKIFEQI
ncbi:MAG: hypothetical protein K8R54_03975 [Bacteroidales bacterium]|nr:hypothetical protein [Bacteroidales bacterium]